MENRSKALTVRRGVGHAEQAAAEPLREDGPDVRHVASGVSLYAAVLAVGDEEEVAVRVESQGVGHAQVKRARPVGPRPEKAEDGVPGLSDLGNEKKAANV